MFCDRRFSIIVYTLASFYIILVLTFNIGGFVVNYGKDNFQARTSYQEYLILHRKPKHQENKKTA